VVRWWSRLRALLSMQNKKSRCQRGERGFDFCVLFCPFIALLVAYTQLSSAAPTLESTPSGSALRRGVSCAEADSQYTVH